MEKVSIVASKIIQIGMSGALFAATLVSTILAVPLMWLGEIIDEFAGQENTYN